MADLMCPIARWAHETPSANAVVCGEQTYSYAQCDQMVSLFTTRFLNKGLKPGEIVATLLPNSPDLVFTLMGLLRAGFIACPMNPRWPDQHITRLLTAIECLHVIADPEMRRTSDGTAIPSPVYVPPGRPATVIFTSGTTGEPKAAVLDYGNHYFSAVAANRNMPLVPGDRWLLSLPLYHVAGWGVLFRCALAGAAVVVPEEHETIEQAISRHAVTHVSLVSTQLHRLLDKPSGIAALSTLKGILLGGGPMPPPLIRRAFDVSLPIHTSYGLTETASQITASRKDDGLDALLTSGYPLEPDTVRIGPGGEVHVRGKTLFRGYLHEGKIERTTDSAGWFATGDVGLFDADGRLSVTGRRDNAFVCGGENIQPEEIERALCECPGVADAVVVPFEDPEYGRIPVAFIRTDPPCTLDTGPLTDFLSKRLPRHKVPRHFLPWPEGTDLPSAKINRANFIALVKHHAPLT